MTDHVQLPVELQQEVMAIVKQTRERSRWPVRRTLQVLEIPPASYYRWCQGRRQEPEPSPCRQRSIYELLDWERERMVSYALKHPEVRHRELAWRMLDEGVCGVSSSSVYRVLREAGLVCRWKPRDRRHGTQAIVPAAPDKLWQTDIRYTKVVRRNYYLLSFIDVYSRYVVHHELLILMDGLSVSLGAADALAKLPEGVRPTIQSDHGSGFVAHEFASTLAGAGVGHTLIRPHTPTDNAVIERYHRTIGERIDQHELEDFTHAKQVITEIIDDYNHHRLHSALQFLRPVDYYRGDPEALLAERRRKLQMAREVRKQENLNLHQLRLPWTEVQTVTNQTRPFVSL